MGNSQQAPYPTDIRVERAKSLFAMPDQQLMKLWFIFLTLDHHKRGLVLIQDVFEQMLQYRRSPLTDTLLTLISTELDAALNFGEFVDLICTVCCFEDTELIKYFFFVLNPHRAGFFQVTELKHLLFGIHPDRSMIREPIKYLENLDANDDHIVDFPKLLLLKQKYPYSFYPIFQLQAHVKQHTFGEYWWETHNANLHDKKLKLAEEERIRKEKAKLESEKDEDAITEELLKQRMGIKYYLMPWTRATEHRKLLRIAAIEADLEIHAQANKKYHYETPYQ